MFSNAPCYITHVLPIFIQIKYELSRIDICNIISMYFNSRLV